jgi:hypothetical protein
MIKYSVHGPGDSDDQLDSAFRANSQMKAFVLFSTAGPGDEDGMDTDENGNGNGNSRDPDEDVTEQTAY